ncbi:MAG: serine hydroxymethyltransferase, partial [Candidatus Kapaibacteriota bacterium]
TKKMSEVVDSWVMPGIQGGPLMHVIAAKAVAFGEALTPGFDEYIQQVLKNAKALANALIEKGYNLVSGGTDNHLMLIDLRNKGVTGKQAETALDKAGITVNKNAVPFDTQPPLITSGIRIGTPAMTTRGMIENDMEKVAELIDRVISNIDKEDVINQVKKEVLDFTSNFPLFHPRWLNFETTNK